MNCAGLIYDDSPHYLDHLAPLCVFLKIPLIIYEPHLADLARTYYPNLKVLEKSLWDISFPSRIISCYSQILLSSAFPNHQLQNIWLPHGSSDKGWKIGSFGALQQDKIALVYGQKMIDDIKKEGICLQTISLGNFRWEYFLKNRSFYQKAMQIPSTDKNILYAPTWDDLEKSNSFWNAFPILIQKIPKNYNLLVKIHPNTIRKFEPEIERYKGLCKDRSNIIFLSDLPPIYPILAACDAYIGDMSSIGYDFLTFNKPLFFLNRADLPLQKCGITHEPQSFIYSQQKDLSHSREQLYQYTFSKTPNWESVRKVLTDL
jgi:hypothetical protein